MTALRSETSAHGRAGLSARSTQLSAGILKSACAWAVGAELVGRNPIATVRRPRAQAPAVNVWTADQARSFLIATRDDRLSVAWALLLGRGLRRGELLGIRWAAVDLEAGALRIDGTLIIADGHTAESRPKTNAGRRNIPLDPHLVALLGSHRARQAAEKLVAGEAYEDGGYVIADELGHPYPVKHLKDGGNVDLSAAADSTMHLPDRQRAGVFGTAAKVVAWMADPPLRSWVVDPKDGRSRLDVTTVLADGSSATLYSLSKEGFGGAGAPDGRPDHHLLERS